jgi:hypothetical protein
LKIQPTEPVVLQGWVPPHRGVCCSYIGPAGGWDDLRLMKARSRKEAHAFAKRFFGRGQRPL